MKKPVIPVTIESIKAAHLAGRPEIQARLAEFAAIRRRANNEEIWGEMVFCFFTGGCSAKMGLRSLAAVRHLLLTGDQPQLAKALIGHHRYPNARSKYIVASRDFLKENCKMEIIGKLDGFADDLARREWLVKEKGIKGLGYKEASHFLRNIGYTGYAILDKHILNCLFELKIISEPKPPNRGLMYLTIEYKLKHLAKTLEIDFEELDLVLWSMKTGEILK